MPALALVTGANGFLGHHVCRALVGRGIQVRALVRRPGVSVIPGAEPYLLKEGLADRAALRQALEDVHTVVHLAAYVHQRPSRANRNADVPSRARSINVDGTRMLLEAGMDAGIRDFVFASTVKVVGEGGPAVWTEETPPEPVDEYGATKLEAERLVRAFASQHGLHAPILRFPLVYGPGMRANALQLFRVVDLGLPLPFGAVRNRRSYLYVGNLVAALFAVLETEAGNDTYFVSDGFDLSTPALLQLVGEALGKPARLVSVPTGLLSLAARAGDVVARAASLPLFTPRLDRLVGSLAIDPSKLGRLTGFRPPYTVREAFQASADWYREQSRRKHV